MTNRKRTKHDLQNNKQKTNDRTTRTPLKPGGELMCFGRVLNICLTDTIPYTTCIRLFCSFLSNGNCRWLTVSSFAVDSRRRSHDGHSPCQAAKCRGVLPYKLQMKSIYIYFINVSLHIMQNSQLKYNYWLLYKWFM
jgi:hypothetical protein